MPPITEENRQKRLAAIQQVMASELTGSPTEIHRVLLQESDMDIPVSTIREYVKECRNANWVWLSETAKYTYIAEMKQRAKKLEKAFNLTTLELESESLKPHARALLNNSLTALSKEISDLVEGQGILRHWDAIINSQDKEWQEAAMQTDTSEEDAKFT